MVCAWCGASPARVVPDVSGEDHACESCLAELRAEIDSNTPTPDRPPRKSSEIEGKPGYFWDGSRWVKNPDKPVGNVDW